MPKNFRHAIPMLLCFSNGGRGFFSRMGGARTAGVGAISSGRMIGVQATGFGHMMCFGPV